MVGGLDDQANIRLRTGRAQRRHRASRAVEPTPRRSVKAISEVTEGGGLYMMPRSDGILLGGTFERRVESLEPNLEAAERIFQGHKARFERMARRVV